MWFVAAALAAPLPSPVADPTAGKLAAEALWSGRADRARLEEALARYGALAHALPGDTAVATRLVRGGLLLARTFETEPRFAVEELAAAVDASAGCGTDPECRYWAVAAQVDAALHDTPGHLLAAAPALSAALEALPPDLDHHGAARWCGIWYASLPTWAGRDLLRAAACFDAADPADPRVHVERAATWAVAARDRATFERELTLARTLPAPDDLGPEGAAEAARATRLLAAEDTLFPAPGPAAGP